MIVSEKEMDTIQLKAGKLVDQLMELGCDSVRLICTVQGVGEMSHCLSSGAGSYYAQLGAVADWAEKNTAQTLANEIVVKDDQDFGEDWK